MKTKFPGYFKPSQIELNKLWMNGIITLDANILLNLYRYSDNTRDEFLKILEKVKDRVWIPNQSAYEFFENRLNVISQQEKAYEEAVSSLNSIEQEFKNSRQHPFISEKLLNKFSDLTKEIFIELNKNKESHNNRILQDDILDKLETLFENKVGDGFTAEEIEKLKVIGEERFNKKIPPGFKDSGKKDSTDNNIRQYGDFFVWQQILNKSKELGKGVILVTDDRKEDWWVRFKGKTLQPRPELIKEFIEFTNNDFNMYQSDRFLEFAQNYLNQEINQKAINEIRELRKLDEERRLMEVRRQRERMKYLHMRENLMMERIKIEQELKHLNESKELHKDKLKEQYLILENSDPSAFDDRPMSLLNHELSTLLFKEQELENRLKSLEKYELNMNRRKSLHNKAYE